MAKLQKYLFDVDFGARPGPREPVAPIVVEVVEEPPPPPPPTFSEEELAQARDQAFQAGRQAGIQEAEAATGRLVAMALSAIGSQLQTLETRQADANEARLKDGVAVAVTVLRKLHPELSRQAGVDEIVGVVHDCLTRLDEDVRVTIRVNPGHLDAIREPAEQVATNVAFEGKLVFTADQRLVPGDCRVEWGDGGAERDQARIWAEIEAVIARAAGAGEQDSLTDASPLVPA